MLTLLRMACSGLCPRLPIPLLASVARSLAPALAVVALLPLALPQGGLRPAAAADNPPPADARAPRPADLVILQEWVTREGPQSIGVYGIKVDPLMPDNRSVQVWQEQLDRVTIATDKIRCSPQGPMRVTGTANRLIVRELNPGGPITQANRLDHLIWWAVCVPAQAGKDPAGLGALARSLGYSGQLIEREEVLVAPRR
ncbi:MAG: hypothetical protein WAM11_02980 [Cyanobium sp.]